MNRFLIALLSVFALAMPANAFVSVTWNGVTYSIPESGDLNWSSLTTFLQALGNNAGVAKQMKQAVRIATTSPVTVSATADFTIFTDLGTPGAVAVNLPSGIDGQVFIIMDGKGDAATNNVTITPASGTIGGGATLVLDHNSEAVLVQYHASSTDWKVLINNLKPGTLRDADISATAAIARTKIANGTADHVVINNGSGTLTSEATLAKVRGGSGQDNSSLTFPASGTLGTLAGTEEFTNKTLTSGIIKTDAKASNQASIKFYEQTGNGTNYIGISAPDAVTADKTFKLPDGDGAAGQVLKTDGSLNLGWVSAATDVTTTRGDLIRRGASAVERLAAVTDNRVVRGDGTDVISGQIDDTGFFTTGAAASAGTVGLVNNDASNTGGTPIKGRTDGSATTAGYIGEYKEAKNNSFQNFSTNVYFAVASINLGAGTWDVEGILDISKNGATWTTPNISAGFSPNGTNNDVTGLDFPITANTHYPLAASVPEEFQVFTPRVRVYCDGTDLIFNGSTYASTTTIYLKAYQGGVSTGAPQYRYFMRATRVN